MYKHEEKTLTTLTQNEADTLLEILNQYPEVFTEIEIIPRDEEEIKLLEDFGGNDGRPLDFDFENVEADCIGILDQLNDNFDSRISGIDRLETVRQKFED